MRIDKDWDKYPDGAIGNTWVAIDLDHMARCITYAKQALASGNLEYAAHWRRQAVHSYLCAKQRRLVPKR